MLAKAPGLSQRIYNLDVRVSGMCRFIHVLRIYMYVTCSSIENFMVYHSMVYHSMVYHMVYYRLK